MTVKELNIFSLDKSKPRETSSQTINKFKATKREKDYSISGEVRMESKGLKLIKEKFKEGTGEQLWTPEVVGKIDTEGE